MGKKVYWQPIGSRGRWDRRFSAQFYHRELDDSLHFHRNFDSGIEREEFIREQNSLVRKYDTAEEYADLYRSILTLTS